MGRNPQSVSVATVTTLEVHFEGVKESPWEGTFLMLQPQEKPGYEWGALALDSQTSSRHKSVGNQPQQSFPREEAALTPKQTLCHPRTLPGQMLYIIG